MASNSIQGILGDEANGAIWFSTFEGISRLNLNNFEFTNYNISDGVHSKQFADGAALRSFSGRYYFGGVNGFTTFTTEQIHGNTIPPEVILCDLRIFNQSVRPGSSSVLSAPIYWTDAIKLPYDQNDISIDFLAMHFINPGGNQYAYKLEN